MSDPIERTAAVENAEAVPHIEAGGEDSGQTQTLNPFFGLLIVAGGMFVVTIFAFVATIFGDPRAPAARLIDQYVGWLIAGEVLAILVIGWLALAFDRTKVLRNEPRYRPSRLESSEA